MKNLPPILSPVFSLLSFHKQQSDIPFIGYFRGAEVLKSNPRIKVKIVGHTGSDGTDTANPHIEKRAGLHIHYLFIGPTTLGFINASALELMPAARAY
jgi:hypothetical protein